MQFKIWWLPGKKFGLMMSITNYAYLTNILRCVCVGGGGSTMFVDQNSTISNFYQVSSQNNLNDTIFYEEKCEL